MRVIKPLRLSVVQRMLMVRRENRLSIGLLVYFPFEAPDRPLPEIAMWQKVVKEIGKDAALDEGLPKPRGEVLVHGKAHAPGGQPRTAFQARLSMGDIDKSIVVVGRRKWTLGGPTPPEPITEMPVTYEKAFGGASYAQNPIGMGAAPVEENGAKVHWLPHLEDPKRLLKHPDDRPPPACFGPIDITWPQRAKKAGTYGTKWLETDFPGLASDIDPEMFQTAPEDQRLVGYFKGGEEITIENMHPTKPRQSTRVPRLRVRCFASMKRAESDSPLLEVPTRLETVLLFPNLERGVALYRCVLQTVEDDAADVASLVAAIEKPEAPKSLDHYEAALRNRLDKEKGHLYGLRDKDLMPEPDPDAPALPDEVVSDMDELVKREDMLQKRGHARAERELEKARLAMRVAGQDPDAALPKAIPPPEKPPKIEDLPDYVEKLQAESKRVQEEAEAKRKDAMAEARAQCEKQGVDFDALLEKAKREGGGPPAFRAELEIQRLRDLADIARNGGTPMEELEAKIEDPAFRKSLEKIEEMQLFAYRGFAHHFPPAPDRSPEDQARLRAEVEAAIAAKKPLVGCDLTGADLHGLSLAGANLREALLERADLSGCDLSGSDLSGAVLTRATLADVKFAGAKLVGTNLGEVLAEGTSFSGANLEKAVFYKARLSSAKLAGVTLRGADMMEAVLEGADLSGVEAAEVLFFKANLKGARFERAKLGKATFFQCSCDGIDFSRANLDATSFVELSAERASFREAAAQNLRLVSATSLPGADFTGADLRLANLREVDFKGAIFDGALCENADFGESNLKGARLRGLRARGARFIRADLTDADFTGSNLMEALLLHAKLPGAKFEQTNLFRATLMNAKGDDRTSFAGSYVRQTLFTPRQGS
ncbi:DUF2169 domain-containing protein [Polyangium jinanense]|uniref:DUF2169 domain-containing protein n=1 Tax=Polyangium jinanense TaxID=2829994 RepID=A0A9X4ARH2_9BACT|nr:DUF2169 domain-containing protein [Polyangium jinanense]MDC3952524.1 DUF2169 domain-containing protein [Polyangium jinanense]MDC3980152.1 DUF2169 domain-containing protein [Polyangium jinanense]